MSLRSSEAQQSRRHAWGGERVGIGEEREWGLGRRESGEFCPRGSESPPTYNQSSNPLVFLCFMQIFFKYQYYMKKAALEIKQVLNLEDPMSKILFTLGLTNMVVSLMTMPLNAYSIDIALQQLVNLLFMLYVLSCFKNGDCNIFAFIISMLTIALLIGEITLRVLYM